MTSLWFKPSTLLRSAGNGSIGKGSTGEDSAFEEFHSGESNSSGLASKGHSPSGYFSGGYSSNASYSSGPSSEGSAADGSPYITFPFGSSKDPKLAFRNSYEDRLKARLSGIEGNPYRVDSDPIEGNGIKSNEIKGSWIKGNVTMGEKIKCNWQPTKSKDRTRVVSTRVMIDLGKAGSSIKTDLAKLKINQLKYNYSVGVAENSHKIPATPMIFAHFPYVSKVSNVLVNPLCYNKAALEGEDKNIVLRTLRNIYPLLLVKYQKIKGSKTANILPHDLMVWHFISKFKKELFYRTNFWANHPDANIHWLMGKQNFSLKSFIQRKIGSLPFCILFYIIMLASLPIFLVTKTKIQWRLKPSQLDFERKGLRFLFTTTSGAYFLLGSVLRSVVISFNIILYYLCKTPSDYRKLISNRHFVRFFNFMYERHLGTVHSGGDKLSTIQVANFYNGLLLPFAFKGSFGAFAHFDYISTPKLSLHRSYQLVDFEKSAHSLNAMSIGTKKDYIQKLGVSYGALKTKNSFISMGQLLPRDPDKRTTTSNTYHSKSSNSRNSTPYRYKPHSLRHINSKPYFVFFDQYENIPSALRFAILEDLAWAAQKAGALLVLKPHPTYPKRWLDTYLKQATSISDVIVPFRKTGRYLKKDFSLAEQSWGLISFYSTSLLQAVLSHKPAIAYNYTSQENYSVVDAYDKGVCFDVRQKEQLAKVMADILAQGPMFRAQQRARQEFFETYPYYADGYFLHRQDKLHQKLGEVAL